jgi:hypothetical protein
MARRTHLMAPVSMSSAIKPSPALCGDMQLSLRCSSSVAFMHAATSAGTL